jgi:BASS family bile acid:Na+ symporter
MPGDDWLNAAARVVVPCAVAVIMFCLGLGLTAGDFARTFRRPRLLAAALPCQLILFPLVALAVARALSLSPPLAAGLVLIACCPISVPANLLARLAGGNVAASIALTTLAAPVSAITIPLALRLTGYWADSAVSHPQLWRISLSVALLVASPVILGMAIRAFAPAAANRAEPAALRAAVVAFAVGLVLAVASCRREIPGSLRSAGLAAAALNVIGVAFTYAVARLLRVEPAGDRIVLTLGSTTRQFAVAAFVALTLCRDQRLLPPAIAYCLLMWLAPLAALTFARPAATQSAVPPATPEPD